MTSIPDPTSIDWGSIALWGAGISTVLASVAVAIIQGVRRALQIAQNVPSAPAALHKTDVYTTDSIALERLTSAIDALNVLNSQQNNLLSRQTELMADTLRVMEDGNLLRREATTERRSLRDALDVNTAATERSFSSLERLQEEIRDLVKEMIRHKFGRT